MPKTIIENAVCENCGVDVRENTAFCYNCGTRVAGEEVLPEQEVPKPETDAEDSEARAALDELAERLKQGEEEDDRLAKAAAERRRARVSPKKTREFRWEADPDDTGVRLAVAALVLALIAAAVVFVTVLSK